MAWRPDDVKRLPLHPRPLPHEALTSWICRLGAAYDMAPHLFIEAALGLPRPAAGLGFIDNNPESELVRRLWMRTGVPVERVWAMTLAGYGVMLMDGRITSFTEYGCQFGSLASTASRYKNPVSGLSADWRPWICEDLLNHYPRSCRKCLAADQVPYTRIHWRAAWMTSCPLHSEMLEPLYQKDVDAVRSYEWMPARQPSAELVALDQITLTAVTTGLVSLPNGRQVHAGVWLRTLRTLIDEMTRPAALLRHNAYVRITRIWREAGYAFHWPLGRKPFEALSPEHRELVLTMAAKAAAALFTGDFTVVQENAGSILRPPPRHDLPDLASTPPPKHRWPSGGWWEDHVAGARHDPQVAWGVRTLLNMSAGRRERTEMDSYLKMIGVPIVAPLPTEGASAGSSTDG